MFFTMALIFYAKKNYLIKQNSYKKDCKSCPSRHRGFLSRSDKYFTKKSRIAISSHNEGAGSRHMYRGSPDVSQVFTYLLVSCYYLLTCLLIDLFTWTVCWSGGCEAVRVSGHPRAERGQVERSGAPLPRLQVCLSVCLCTPPPPLLLWSRLDVNQLRLRGKK